MPKNSNANEDILPDIEIPMIDVEDIEIPEMPIIPEMPDISDELSGLEIPNVDDIKIPEIDSIKVPNIAEDNFDVKIPNMVSDEEQDMEIASDTIESVMEAEEPVLQPVLEPELQPSTVFESEVEEEVNDIKLGDEQEVVNNVEEVDLENMSIEELKAESLKWSNKIENITKEIREQLVISIKDQRAAYDELNKQLLEIKKH